MLSPGQMWARRRSALGLRASWEPAAVVLHSTSSLVSKEAWVGFHREPSLLGALLPIAAQAGGIVAQSSLLRFRDDGVN